MTLQLAGPAGAMQIEPYDSAPLETMPLFERSS